MRTVQTEAQIGPPMLNVAAARAPFTCSSFGALPSSCQAHQPIMATPVAPIGWPLAMRPPEVLMPHSPAGRGLALHPVARALPVLRPCR